MLLRPSTTTQFHSTMRHMRPGLSKNSKKGTTMRSCRSGRAGENPEVGGRRGADDLVFKRTNGSAVRGVRQLDGRPADAGAYGGGQGHPALDAGAVRRCETRVRLRSGPEAAR